MPWKNKEDKREYQRRWAKRKMKKRKELALRMLGGEEPECEECGFGVVSSLEFDHVDPETKEFNIVRGYSRPLEEFKKEVQKCQLLCTSCHIDKSLENDEYHPQAEKIRARG